jgi:hypothetical protein
MVVGYGGGMVKGGKLGGVPEKKDGPELNNLQTTILPDEKSHQMFERFTA